MKNLKNILLIIGVIIIIILLLKPDKIIHDTKIIQGKQDTLLIYKDSIIKKIEYIHHYHKSIDTVKQILEDAKIEKDTVKIIVVQDSIIKMQTKEIKHLFNAIDLQTDVIIRHEEVDSLRVKENEILKQDNKKMKRKLFGVSAVAVLISIVAILK
jgi:hypothetical protein